jgi:hypothetical protein
MAATTGYQAGVETNSTQISYAVETVWGDPPASAPLQAIRYTSETLSLNKTRSRPSEITGLREASQGVTTQQQATGTISYALSFGTFDDLIACCFQNDWSAPVAVAGIGGDITITAGTNVLSSTLSTKFQSVVQGQWISLSGFTNAGNNGLWFVETKTDDSHLVLSGAGTIVTETPTGTAANVSGGQLKNGATFRSLFIQQKFSPALFLTYPGAYVTRWTLTGGIGNFPTGGFDIVAKGEVQAITDSSTGAVVGAPTGRVFDPVAGWITATWDEDPIGVAIDQFSLTVENTGAAAEMAMGSADAAGILTGTFTVTGSFRTYFKDFEQYSLFAAETEGRLAFQIKDAAGSAYVLTILSAILLVQIDVGGPGQAVYATCNVEGGPALGGGTMTIDRMPAS